MGTMYMYHVRTQPRLIAGPIGTKQMSVRPWKDEQACKTSQDDAMQGSGRMSASSGWEAKGVGRRIILQKLPRFSSHLDMAAPHQEGYFRSRWKRPRRQNLACVTAASDLTVIFASL